jgi:uncharacterized protein YkwD
MRLIAAAVVVAGGALLAWLLVPALDRGKGPVPEQPAANALRDAGGVMLSTIESSDVAAAEAVGPQIDAPLEGGVAGTVGPINDAEAAEPPLVAAINGVRREHGLVALRVSPALARAGDAHAKLLAREGEFEHDWGNAPFARWIPRFYSDDGYDSWSAGENLVWQREQLTPGQAVARWLGSPTHRAVLLAPQWREVGIGVIKVENAPGAYAGQDVVIAAAEFGVRER